VSGGPSLLLGPASLDIYLGHDLMLPGGGALNMAWHLRGEPDPFVLLTRVGDDRPGVFRAFLERHGIAHPAASLVAPGPSCSIDIEIRPDLQPWMDNFVEGVWADYRTTPDEQAVVAVARRLHLVLVEGAIRELARLHVDRALAGAEVTADFLGFRHYTVERFAATMAMVDLGFVGWPGDGDDPAVGGIRAVAHRLGKLVVVTQGAREVRVFDGRPDGGGDLVVPVVPVPVVGTTVGCGDAFVAGFLGEWRRSRDVLAAVEAGKRLGAAATAWRRPLPDEAYGPEAAAALAAADAAATSGSGIKPA
jgi:fructoselysine 6-kinase